MSSSTSYLNRAKEIFSTTNGEVIRNICIIAHVDHGKTTLSDFLLASNNHVSTRQIENGQKTGEAVRFLDSRLDEINRQITIKSSCVSLVYQDHLINLIDSPGHVDFSAEVSAAARLTDGGILVIDCIEGVRAQTCTVIRQAWDNRIVPILFINKLDRMVELVSDCGEAYSRIRNIIENVNIQFHNLLEAYKEEKELPAIPDHLIHQYQFDPTHGNVLFGSALHGWGFDLKTWTAKLVAPKMMKILGSESDTVDDVCDFLHPYMFGQWQVPRKRSAPALADSPNSTMFTKVVLEQIWTLYDRDPIAAKQKLCESFPVAKSIFEAVIKTVPPPKQALVERAKIFTDDEAVNWVDEKISTTVFLVKHHPADLAIGCLLGDRVDGIRTLNGFVGISRVFSGTVSVGAKFFTLSPDTPENHVLHVKRIYMLMGSSLIPINQAGPGCVVGLEFAEDPEHLPTAGSTLSTNPDSPSFVSPYEMAHAIVRVTAEVLKSADEEKLDHGLALLARSDPAVVVSRHAQTGERIVGCCGDEHLARCIQDLENLFAVGISLRISAPIVEIRESVGNNWMQPGEDEEEEVGDFVNILPAWLSEFSGIVDLKARNRSATVVSPDKACTVTVAAEAIPEKAMEWIEHWRQPLRMLFHERHVPTSHLWPHVKEKTLEACMQSVTEIMTGFGVSNIVDLHVKNEAINILTCASPVPDSVKFGFQQACMSGPLAEEPCRGVVWKLIDTSISTDNPSSVSYAVNTGCRASILASPVRVSEPMLSLEIQTEEIKATQSVLATRRADIFHSDLVEGSYSEYLIKALLPASEAFRLGDKSKQTFSDELRGATHGKVVWRLSFSHWAVIDSDSPLTHGVSNKLVCNVRKRKGLTIGEKVVDDPDKQRTLTKMK